jgi:hypothetical protein
VCRLHPPMQDTAVILYETEANADVFLSTFSRLDRITKANKFGFVLRSLENLLLVVFFKSNAGGGYKSNLQ